MRKREKLFILKYCLNVFNGISLVFGLMLVAFGLWILLDSNIFFTLLLSTGERSLSVFSHLLLVTGSVTLFTGLLGCLGSLHEIRGLVAVVLPVFSWVSSVPFLQALLLFRSQAYSEVRSLYNAIRGVTVQYMGLLVLLLGFQSTILVLLYTRQEMVTTLWKTQLDELMSTYGNKNLTEKAHQWDILDDFQRTVHCCGRHNITDWKLNEYKEHANQVPCSCTTFNMKQWFCDALKNAIYVRGCEEDTKMWFEKNVWVLISINCGLLSVEVLQFLIAAWLLRLIKKTQVLPQN